MSTPAADRLPADINERRRASGWILRLFQERVKELVARMLQDDARDLAALMNEVVAILPSAWQHPEAAAARIVLGERQFCTANFRVTRWRQTAPFVTGDGMRGLIEVVYFEEFPREAEGPFLAEERKLIDFLAAMFHGFMGRKLARQALIEDRDRLELRVKERTAELEAEIAERKRTERDIRSYQEQLRSLASQLSLTEERERRAIAANLHDTIGQTLAMAKMKVRSLAGSPDNRGKELAELEGFVESALEYTRSLTFELSSPLLYELGLEPAVEALAERLQDKHGLRIDVEAGAGAMVLKDEAKVIVFKAIRELLTNAIKHAGARRVRVAFRRAGRFLRVRVEDDGAGFEVSRTAPSPGRPCGFGLFSIREGMRHCGGSLEIRSSPGRGTVAVLKTPIREGPRR